MRPEPTRRRFLGRVVLLFMLGTAIPLVVLALLTATRLDRYLQRQHEARLTEAAKTYGMSVVERLRHSGGVLATLARDPGPGDVLREERQRELAQWFSAIDLARAGEPVRPLLDAAHGGGGDALAALPGGPDLPRLRVPLAGWGGVPGSLTARLRLESLLLGGATGTAWPNGMELTVLSAGGGLVYSSLSDPRPVEAALAGNLATGHRQTVAWSGQEGERHVAGAWRVPLRLHAGGDDWIVALSAPASAMPLGARPFVEPLMLVVVAAFLATALVTLRRIRATLTPLDLLREKAQRMGRQDFSSPVRIATGDEFEEIGAIMNGLADQLGQQFALLGNLHEIARASLFAPTEPEQLARKALAAAPEICRARCVAVALATGDGSDRFRLLVRAGAGGDVFDAEGPLPLLGRLAPGGPDDVVDCDPREAGALFPGDLGAGVESVTLFLLGPASRVDGVLAIGAAADGLGAEERHAVRELADQVALGLANGRLIGDLERLYEGTLTALARAIDASSPWTLGHSERVTTYSLAIGRRLALDEQALETLERATVLHDIGKLGLPREVLDAPRALTADERLLIESHVEKGVRILEPVPGFGGIVPIVAQHHEAFDGSGYPAGLAGVAICLPARILAVADTFDAITSDRPYRRGRTEEQAAAILVEEAGRQLDAEVVEAFIAVLREEGVLGADFTGAPPARCAAAG